METQTQGSAQGAGSIAPNGARGSRSPLLVVSELLRARPRGLRCGPGTVLVPVTRVHLRLLLGGLLVGLGPLLPLRFLGALGGVLGKEKRGSVRPGAPPLPAAPFPASAYLGSVVRFPLAPGLLALLLGLLVDHQLALLVAAALGVAFLLPIALRLPRGGLGAGLLLGGLEGIAQGIA